MLGVGLASPVRQTDHHGVVANVIRDSQVRRKGPQQCDPWGSDVSKLGPAAILLSA